MSQGTEFVNKWMNAVNRGDLETLVSMCNPDVELSNPDGSFRGAEGVRAAFKPVVDASSERDVKITNLVEIGDTLVVEFVFSLRHTGPLATPMGVVPATNKVGSVPMMAIYELRNGKLAGSRGQYDRLTIVTQLGLLGAPTPS